MARNINKKADTGSTSGALMMKKNATPRPKNTRKATPIVSNVPSYTASSGAAQRGAGAGRAVGPTSAAGKAAQAPKMNARRISQPLYKNYVNSTSPATMNGGTISGAKEIQKTKTGTIKAKGKR